MMSIITVVDKCYKVSWLSRLVGHFGDESFESVSCSGTDNKTHSNQEKIRENLNQNWNLCQTYPR